MSVWIKQRSHDRDVYHSDNDCADLQRLQNPHKVSLALVDRMGLEECSRCANDVDRSTSDWSHQNALQEAANE